MRRLFFSVFLLLFLANRAEALNYSASVAISLFFPPAVTNTFGYAILNDADLWRGSAANGNATATANWPTSTYAASTLSFTASVSGFAGGPFGTSTAWSIGDSRSANLANLTGSGPPTPPAQVYDAAFTGTYSYTASVTNDLPGILDDGFAEVWFQILNATTGIPVFAPVHIQQNGFGTQQAVNVPFAFSVPLPPNSITKLRIDPYAKGWGVASSVPPIPPTPPDPPLNPIPEPCTLFLLVSGVAGLAGGLRRKRLFKKP